MACERATNPTTDYYFDLCNNQPLPKGTPSNTAHSGQWLFSTNDIIIREANACFLSQALDFVSLLQIVSVDPCHTYALSLMNFATNTQYAHGEGLLSHKLMQEQLPELVPLQI